MAKGQVRTAGMSGEIIDLDFASVKVAMDMIGVVDQKSVFPKVLHAFYHFLSLRRAKGK